MGVINLFGGSGIKTFCSSTQRVFLTSGDHHILFWDTQVISTKQSSEPRLGLLSSTRSGRPSLSLFLPPLLSVSLPFTFAFLPLPYLALSLPSLSRSALSFSHSLSIVPIVKTNTATQQFVSLSTSIFSLPTRSSHRSTI